MPCVSPITVNPDQDQMIYLVANAEYDKKTTFLVPFGYSGMMVYGEKKSPVFYDKEQVIVKLLQEMRLPGMPPVSFFFFKQQLRDVREFAVTHIPFVDGMTGKRGECGLYGQLQLGVWDEQAMLQRLEQVGGGFTEENLRSCMMPGFQMILRRVVVQQLREMGFDQVFSQLPQLSEAVYQQARDYFESWGVRLLQVDIPYLRCPALEGDAEEEEEQLSGAELAMQLKSACNGISDEKLREQLEALMNALYADGRNFALREMGELVQLIRELPLAIELGEDEMIREYIEKLQAFFDGE